MATNSRESRNSGRAPQNVHSIALRILNKWQVGRRPVLIVGHGRSGTTWVGSVFSRAQRVLFCFEPASPKVSGRGGPDTWFHYLRPGEVDQLFTPIFDSAFSGMPQARGWQRSGYHRLIPGYQIVVKDVAALMAIEWLADRYDPAVVIVMRHPCPTILSELKQGTSAELSRTLLLQQQELMTDHLEPYRAVLEAAETEYEILAAIWAARQFVVAGGLSRHPDWHVICYETLCIDPQTTYKSLFEKVNIDWTDGVAKFVQEGSTRNEPGQYTPIRISAQQAWRWREDMDTADVQAIRRIVERFNLPFYQSDDDWIGPTI